MRQPRIAASAVNGAIRAQKRRLELERRRVAPTFSKLDELEKKRGRIARTYADGALSDEEYDEGVSAVKRQIVRLHREIDGTVDTRDRIKSLESQILKLEGFADLGVGNVHVARGERTVAVTLAFPNDIPGHVIEPPSGVEGVNDELEFVLTDREFIHWLDLEIFVHETKVEITGKIPIAALRLVDRADMNGCR